MQDMTLTVRNSTTFSNTFIITKISNIFEPQFHLLLKIVTELSEHFASCFCSLLKLVTLLCNVSNVTKRVLCFYLIPIIGCRL